MEPLTLLILGGAIKSPPLSSKARIRVGGLLRQIQQGELIPMPHSRPMPSVGARVHELRVRGSDANANWRVISRIDTDFLLVLDAFPKKTAKTPRQVIESCRTRLRLCDSGSQPQ